LLFLGGELGESGEDWGVDLVVSSGGGDLDHFLCNSGEFNEVSSSLVD